MRLIFIEPPTLRIQGDQVYRTRQPAVALCANYALNVTTGSLLSRHIHAQAETADVVWLNQVVDYEILGFIARRRKKSLTTIFEINDNFLEAKSFGDVGAFYHNRSTQQLVYDLASQADGLAFSSTALKEQFGHLNPRCAVIPNAREETSFCRPSNVDGHVTKIGWGGSAGHFDDWRDFAPALKKLLDKYPKLVFAIMAPESLRVLFEDIAPDQLEWHFPGELVKYQKFLATLQIGLAPLGTSDFASGRSDVKFIEYTQAHVPAVLSEAKAYREQAQWGLASIAHSPEGMMAAVETLMHDPAARSAQVARASQWVEQHRLPQALARARMDFMVQCAPKQSLPPQAASNSGPSRPIHLEPKEPELCLLAALQRQSSPDQALPYLHRACQLEPSFYLPWLYAGALEPDKNRRKQTLGMAARLAPQALSPRWIGAEQDGKDAPGRAVTNLRTLLGDFPSFAPGWMLLAQLQGRLGDHEASKGSLTAVFQLRPFDEGCRLALAEATLRLAESTGRRSELEVDLLEVDGLLQGPKSGPFLWDWRLVSARAAKLKDRWPEAARHLAPALQAKASVPQRLYVPALSLLAEASLQCGNQRAAMLALERIKSARSAPDGPENPSVDTFSAYT